MEDSKLTEARSSELWGKRSNCPNPCAPEKPHLSRAAAERRLGDRSLPSQRLGALAVLAAQARGRASEAVLPGRARLRSAAGRLSRTRRREAELQERRNHVFETAKDGSAIHGNSVLGHSLEGTQGPGKPGVIGRMLTDDERYDLIEYLKTL